MFLLKAIRFEGGKMKFITLAKQQTFYLNKPGNVIFLITLLSLLLIDVSQVFSGGGPNVRGAKLYIRENQLDKAIEVLTKEITERDPNNEDAWYLFGYVYARQQKYEKMVEAFDKAVELKPKFKDDGIKINGDKGTILNSGSVIFSQLGSDMIRRHIWQNIFTIGVNSFNEAISTEDDSTRNSNYKIAIENFKASALILPDSVFAYKNMAAALWNLGKYEESVAPLVKAVELKPENIDIKVMLAQTYSIVKQDSLALPILEDLWSQGVRDTEVADNLARAYTETGQIEKAKTVFQDALSEDPENFQLITNYGSLLFNAIDYENALVQFEKSYAIQPESKDANFNLGYTYFKMGLQKYDALEEESEDTTHVNDFRASFPYIELATSMNSDDQDLWLVLGNVSGRIEKMSLAGFAFAKAEELLYALDDKVYVGMLVADVKALLGEPTQIKNIESEAFQTVEEWIYQPDSEVKRKIEVPNQINLYIDNGEVTALYQFK